MIADYSIMVNQRKRSQGRPKMRFGKGGLTENCNAASE
jgi:hypothetical protein